MVGGAPWTVLLIELERLAPAATIVGASVDGDARQIALQLRQARAGVALSAEIAMSFGEADRVGRGLAELATFEQVGSHPRLADEVTRLLEDPDGACLLVAVVALIRALMRPGVPAHA